MEDQPTAWIEVVSVKPGVVPEFSRGEPIQAQAVGKSEAPRLMAQQHRSINRSPPSHRLNYVGSRGLED